jgi:hypothetical protein
MSYFMSLRSPWRIRGVLSTLVCRDLLSMEALSALLSHLCGTYDGISLIFFLMLTPWLGDCPGGVGLGGSVVFLIHDHPGTLTSFVLGVKYPDGSVHHDLGLYLSLVGFAIGLIFLIFRRRRLPPGFFVAAFFVLDATARLWLDFYRLADTRYASLTPTQWISIPLILGGGYWLVGMLRSSPKSSA